MNKEQRSLLGRSGVIKFPDATAEVSYGEDASLHWKVTTSEGEVSEGDEAMDYKRLSDELHFLNWIEADGFTVSQVINTQTGMVQAFWSYADAGSSRGKRNSSFLEGVFEYR